MTSFLLIPPVAFVIYLVLAAALARIGQVLAGPSHANKVKSSTYSSGEAHANSTSMPGYRPFFLIALFFAILHLSVLVLGSGGFTLITAAYLVGIVLALLTLILG